MAVTDAPLDDTRVALARDAWAYARSSPFNPSERFPEWPQATLGTEDNPAYRAVRRCLELLGYDAANFGSPDWNPLGDIVEPGHTVFLKPNFVSHRNFAPNTAGPVPDTDPLVTHGSVIRAVADYVARALRGQGRIIIGDCPIQDTDWDALLQVVGLPGIVASLRTNFPGVAVELRDYRHGKAIIRGNVMVARTTDDTTSPAALEIELGDDSLLAPLMDGKSEFGVSRYPRHRMRNAHTATSHRYLMGRDFLEADVFISLPKMKSHQKAGITCSLKNLVGVNAHKDYLPHFRYGSPKNGGDEYPDGNWFWDLMWAARHQDWDRESGLLKLAFFAVGAAGKVLLPWLGGRPRADVSMGAGGWHGNDTLWRTVLDLNRAFYYFDRDTKRVGSQWARRPCLTILDGLVGGHRESPLAPSAALSGVMLAARNPVALDAVAATLMHLDINRLQQIREAFRLASRPLVSFAPEDVRVLGEPGVGRLADLAQVPWSKPFEPSRGFRGHVERVAR